MSAPSVGANAIEATPALPSLGEATRVWARIGLMSFGGPAGQIALMHRELVEQRRWIGEQRFLHALNYCMLLPGPEAQQLTVYIGWLLHRTAGGLIAGLLFILPGALVMLALSIFYVLWRQVPVVDAAFFGIKAAVLAIVLEALFRIARRALKNSVMYAVAAIAFVGIYVLQIPFPLIVIGAGLFGLIGRRLRPQSFDTKGQSAATAEHDNVLDSLFAQGALEHTRPTLRRAVTALVIWLPLWLGPVALLFVFTGGSSVWSGIGSFFSGMAVVTFGGAYAVLAYVAQAAVESYHWLQPGEMADGLGLAETTPGPLILVLQFVGFLAAYRAAGTLDPLLAGMLGAFLTLWVTFAPCFLWIFLGAPFVEALRGNKALAAALSSITAAVVGVILNLTLWFGLHVLFGRTFRLDLGGVGPDLPVIATLDWQAALLALAAIVLLLRFHVGMVWTLACVAAAGIALKLAA